MPNFRKGKTQSFCKINFNWKTYFLLFLNINVIIKILAFCIWVWKFWLAKLIKKGYFYLPCAYSTLKIWAIKNTIYREIFGPIFIFAPLVLTVSEFKMMNSIVTNSMIDISFNTNASGRNEDRAKLPSSVERRN